MAFANGVDDDSGSGGGGDGGGKRSAGLSKEQSTFNETRKEGDTHEHEEEEETSTREMDDIDKHGNEKDVNTQKKPTPSAVDDDDDMDTDTVKNVKERTKNGTDEHRDEGEDEDKDEPEGDSLQPTTKKRKKNIEGLTGNSKKILKKSATGEKTTTIEVSTTKVLTQKDSVETATTTATTDTTTTTTTKETDAGNLRPSDNKTSSQQASQQNQKSTKPENEKATATATEKSTATTTTTTAAAISRMQQQQYWDRCYTLLVEYKKSNGHFRIPIMPQSELGDFVKSIRRSYLNLPASSQRICDQILHGNNDYNNVDDDINDGNNNDDETSNGKADNMDKEGKGRVEMNNKSYHDDDNHNNKKKKKKKTKIVMKKRLTVNGLLTIERMRQLRDISFDLSPSSYHFLDNWDYLFNLLRQFKSIHGHTKVPARAAKDGKIRGYLSKFTDLVRRKYYWKMKKQQRIGTNKNKKNNNNNNKDGQQQNKGRGRKSTGKAKGVENDNDDDDGGDDNEDEELKLQYEKDDSGEDDDEQEIEDKTDVEDDDVDDDNDDDDMGYDDSVDEKNKAEWHYVDDLTEERIRQLQDIGFDFKYRRVTKDQWEKHYQSLVTFKEEHGHFRVPKASYLSKWCTIQRRGYKNAMQQMKCQQSRERKNGKKKKTTSNNDDNDDIDNRDEFELYATRPDGHTKYKRYVLSPERIVKLQLIGFTWEGQIAERNATWEQHYINLLKYKAIHGHCNVPKSYPLDNFLGRWCHAQRQAWSRQQRGLKGGKALTSYKIQKLQEIGFDFCPKVTNYKLNITDGSNGTGNGGIENNHDGSTNDDNHNTTTTTTAIRINKRKKASTRHNNTDGGIAGTYPPSMRGATARTGTNQRFTINDDTDINCIDTIGEETTGSIATAAASTATTTINTRPIVTNNSFRGSMGMPKAATAALNPVMMMTTTTTTTTATAIPGSIRQDNRRNGNNIHDDDDIYHKQQLLLRREQQQQPQQQQQQQQKQQSQQQQQQQQQQHMYGDMTTANAVDDLHHLFYHG